MLLLFGAHVHHRFHGPHVDYIGVGVAAAASWIGVAGVGEAALIAAGIAAARGKVDLASVLLVAWFGACAGGMIGWAIGLKGGRGLMTRAGPLFRLRTRLLRHGDEIYDRRGWLAVFFAPSWMAGVSGMRAGRFIAANTVSALVWALGIGLGAYLIGPSITDLADDIGLVGAIAIGAVVVATVVGGRRWRQSRVE